MFGNIPGRTFGRKGEEATTCGPGQPAELHTHASTVHWPTQPRDSPPRLLAAGPGHHSSLPQACSRASQPRAPAWGTAARPDQTSALLFLSPFPVPNQSLRPSPSPGMFAQELIFFSCWLLLSPPQGRLPQCRSPLCPRGPSRVCCSLSSALACGFDGLASLRHSFPRLGLSRRLRGTPAG